MREDYRQFLAGKAPRAQAAGFEPSGLPSALKPFQHDLVTWGCRLGRSANFSGTGLGKSFMELAWSDQVVKHTSKPSLNLAPLAVAQQTVAEARKFGIDGVGYARDQSEAEQFWIPVTNYERIEKFDLSKFGSIVPDESSIIKSHESQIRRTLIEMCRNIAFRFPCTATPAPNDYVELGNHSEFLGILAHKEMLATWFVHEGSGRAQNVGNKNSAPAAEWRLKGHAETDFWRWLASWAAVVRHPRDLGYEDPGYDLLPLHRHQITVPADYVASAETGTLFPIQASTLQERLGARRQSILPRVKAAAELVNSHRDRQWLVWCHLNDEADALIKAIDGAVEVRGSHDPEIKTERLLGFASGAIPILISKPQIAGWGMNFQSCHNMIFVGLNDSFEQLYQAIRRCWRFGQTKPVNAYLIASELEGAVVSNLIEKEAAAERMGEAMAEHMRDLTVQSVRGITSRIEQTLKPMEVPAWLTAA